MHGQAGDVVAVEDDGAAVRRQQPRQHVEEGRLAGAVRADEAVQPVGVNLQADIVGHDQRAEALVEMADLEDRLRRVERRMPGLPGRDGGRPWRDAGPRQRPVGAPAQAEHQALHALGRGKREQDHDRREHQPPAFGQGRQPVLQQDEGDGAPQRPEEMVHAAQHRHQQRIARMLPAEIVGVGALQHQGQESARVADEAAHQHEGGELQPERVVAQALRPLLVVAQRLQGAAERRMGDAP